MKSSSMRWNNQPREILREIFEREYLSRRAIGGTVPWLNQVFEEMRVKYGDQRVLEKMLKSV